jgi:phosphoribosylamine--glycine ligase
MSGLVKEGRPFVGVLFIGLMLTEGGPKVLEYNVRFGDPECQALMLRLGSDLVNILLACVDGTLDQQTVSWDPRTSVCVTLASGGYPGDYAVGKPITGIAEAEAGGAIVFHAGTAEKAGSDGTSQLVTAGGRVLSVCGRGANLDEARAVAYAAAAKIHFDGKHYRSDIGKRREARKGG